MTQYDSRNAAFRKVPSLHAVKLAITFLPIVFVLISTLPIRAQSHAEDASTLESPVFAVASIKPIESESFAPKTTINFEQDRYIASNCTLEILLEDMYGVDVRQIIGAPEWINSASYEIEARMDNETYSALRKLSYDQLKLAHRQMVQALLADRFKLTLHGETRELPIYSLVVARRGPKLHEANPGDTYANGTKWPDGAAMGAHSLGYSFMVGHVQIPGQGATLDQLVKRLTQELGRKVIDNTGLTGNYDFMLDFYVPWTRNLGQDYLSVGIENSEQNAGQSSGPSLFSAIQDQLGLKLESRKGPVEVLIIDHVEKPSAN